MSDFVFRALGYVVNTAAWAANNVLEVMYPKLDLPAARLAGSNSGTAAHEAVPQPDRVADAAGDPPSPAASLSDGDCFDCCIGHPETLTWDGWAVPAILDVLADHLPDWLDPEGPVDCIGEGEEVPHATVDDLVEWREHVAPLIAARIGCDPARAALALTSLQTQ